jgi:hypothetical protein
MEKFSKKRLLQYLQKVNLSGLANKVWIENKSDHTIIDNILDDSGNLIINSKVSKNIFEEGINFGIYDMQLFLRYLTLFEADQIGFKFTQNEDKENNRIMMSDKNKNITYVLAKKDNIPVKEFNKDPFSNIKISFKLSSSEVADIKKALEVSGSKFVNFVNKKSSLMLYIGDIDSKEHLIKFKISDYDEQKQLDQDIITFSSNYFSSILTQNDKVDIKLTEGLMIYENKDDNIETKYFQRGLISKK